MPARNLLHKTKLSEFTDWLTENRIKWRKSTHAWQKIQIRARQSTGHMGWTPVFDNLGSDHFTIPDNLIGLVAAFTRDSKDSNRRDYNRGY